MHDLATTFEPADGWSMIADPPLESVTVYRVIRTDISTPDDLRSHMELGIPLRRDDPESLRLASGISLFDSLQRARKQARRKPWMGNALIAEVAIPADGIRIEKTAGPGHYTAWGARGARGAPSAMLSYVQCVERV